MSVYKTLWKLYMYHIINQTKPNKHVCFRHEMSWPCNKTRGQGGVPVKLSHDDE